MASLGGERHLGERATEKNLRASSRRGGVSRETSGFGRQGAPGMVFGAIFGATIVLKRFQRRFVTGEVPRDDVGGDFRAGKVPRDDVIGDFRAGKVPKMMRGSFFRTCVARLIAWRRRFLRVLTFLRHRGWIAAAARLVSRETSGFSWQEGLKRPRKCVVGASGLFVRGGDTTRRFFFLLTFLRRESTRFGGGAAFWGRRSAFSGAFLKICADRTLFSSFLRHLFAISAKRYCICKRGVL